jgi:hypothetical protein
MPFVYTGKGRKGGTTENGSPPQCAKLACAIQWCLAKRNHKEVYCQSFIDEWKKCRDKFMALHELEKQSAAANGAAAEVEAVATKKKKKAAKATVSS